MNIIDWISAPLSVLLEWCCGLFSGELAGILVFTLLTKLILFPVSLWVHANGVSLVRITPGLNRLKLKYYGDKDTVAEETLKL